MLECKEVNEIMFANKRLLSCTIVFITLNFQFKTETYITNMILSDLINLMQYKLIYYSHKTVFICNL